MKLSMKEKKVLYAFACPNHHNTVTRLKWLTALTVDPQAKHRMLELARKMETEMAERWYTDFYHQLRAEMDEYYDKAVEVVTDTVRLETHKEDIRLVEETKNWVLSPERKAPQKEREYAAARLDGVISKIKNAMQSALTKIQKKLMQPEVKKAGKLQIQEKAKESILAFLNKSKQDSAQREANRKKQQQRKQDMEL